MKTVSIVGRPNVGKSRLFNRIIGRRKAIVDDKPGITRDRLEHVVDHGGFSIRWIDTGGIGVDDEFGDMITLQAEVAISVSDLVVLVVDGRSGIMPADEVIADKLRKKSDVLLCINKVDDDGQVHSWADFARLGFKDIFSVSAEHGRGVDDMVDAVIARLGDADDSSEEHIVTRVSIIGRPNVGKSSLVNAILGEDRVIVSDIPGTTRDAIESNVVLREGTIQLVDTAGIRKKRRQYSKLESIMVGRARKAVEHSDVAVVVTDAVEGVTDQDIRIADGALKLGKGCVIALNKWDLITDKKFDEIVKKIRHKLGSEAHLPIVSISALKRQRIHRLMAVALQVGASANVRITTSALNKILFEAGRRAPAGVRIKYGIQKSIAPPTFLIFGAGKIPRPLERFLITSIRESGGYMGVPIIIEARR